MSGSPGSLGQAATGREGIYGVDNISTSPPLGARPMSHPNQFTNFGGRAHKSHQDSPSRDRRASAYSLYNNRQPFVQNPPLPHQAQPHFYGLPNLDLGLNPVSGGDVNPGESGYHCGFDTLGTAGHDPSKVAENVLLIGYEGGIDILKVDRRKMDVVGRLEGLRGAVIAAKVIPWTFQDDLLRSSRPLIAVVVHGPVINNPKTEDESCTSSAIQDGNDPSPSRPTSSTGDEEGAVSHYQTTVEIYSLKSHEHIDTLYKSPRAAISSPLDSPVFKPPPPQGDLRLDANGKIVVVASGSSGEVFLFAPYSNAPPRSDEKFKCVGKLWTSVIPISAGTGSSSSSNADAASHDSDGAGRSGNPLISLSHRWIAIVPPSSSINPSLNGDALMTSSNLKPPGSANHTPPPQPTVNCAIDAPEGDGIANWVAREGTQAAIKGARWATERGMQAFRNYFGKPGAEQPPLGVDPYNGDILGAQPAQNFPPTHAHVQAAAPPSGNETTVVSIFDLNRLLDFEETRSKHALQPVATFAPLRGCSFLSFSPNGLMLMTVSKKGDFQYIWNLMRLNHRRSRRSGLVVSVGPHVRQVVRFSRMTVANVVDVIWSTPQGSKVAILTEKGTVHMYPVPPSAFQWPPPRSFQRHSSNHGIDGKSDTSGYRASKGVVGSTMQAINGISSAVRPQSKSLGQSSRFSFNNFSVTSAVGAKSSKAVASGFTKSISTAASNFRHAGDNRISMPSTANGVKQNSVRWMTGRAQGSIALVSGGNLAIFTVKMRAPKGKNTPAAIAKKTMVEFGLPQIRGGPLSPSILHFLDSKPGEPPNLLPLEGTWLLKTPIPAKSRTTSPLAHPLSFAEIETNPPYLPFRTDRRVTYFTIPNNGASMRPDSQQWDQGVSLDLHTQECGWVFGEDIPAVRVPSSGPPYAEAGAEGEEDDDAVTLDETVENRIIRRRDRKGEEEEEVQIIVTTRRKKRLEGQEDGEEGFFEDDCEVLDWAEDRV